MRRTKKEKEEQSSENNSNFFQLFHSISSLLSTLSILPIPNYKLPKAICNAIISDRQVLTLPLLLVQLWFDFAKWKQVAEATWLLSVFQCVPDQTWRFIGGIDIDTISRNSALRSAVAKKFFFPAEHQSALESNTSSIFSAPITGEARSNRFPRYIYIYIYRVNRVAWKEFICRNLAGRSPRQKASSFIVGRTWRTFWKNFFWVQVFSIDGDLVLGDRCWILRNCGFNFVWENFSSLLSSRLVWWNFV